MPKSKIMTPNYKYITIKYKHPHRQCTYLKSVPDVRSNSQVLKYYQTQLFHLAKSGIFYINAVVVHYSHRNQENKEPTHYDLISSSNILMSPLRLSASSPKALR